MGEICSLCKQALLCGVTTNYTSWGYSPSFLIVLFFHIREGKEMGDVREKMQEKNTAWDLQCFGHHFSQPLHGKHLQVTEHFDVCLTNLGSPTPWMAHSQGTASLMAAALAGNSWVEYWWKQLNTHQLLIPVSSFCCSVNIKYGKCHNYCSFGDIKV